MVSPEIDIIRIQIQINTNNFILHQIKNNKTLATSYLSMVNMYNIIQLFTIKLT